MNPGRTYLITLLSVAVVTQLCIRKRPARPTQGEVYRYPTGIQGFIFCATPFYGLAGLHIYSQVKPNDWVALLIPSVLLPALSLVYAYVQRFYIEVTDAALTIGSLFTVRQHSWSEVQRISVLYGARGGADLKVSGPGQKPLLKVGATLQGFGRLVATLKHNSKSPGVVFRERDSAGNWSESTH